MSARRKSIPSVGFFFIDEYSLHIGMFNISISLELPRFPCTTQPQDALWHFVWNIVFTARFSRPIGPVRTILRTKSAASVADPRHVVRKIIQHGPHRCTTKASYTFYHTNGRGAQEYLLGSTHPGASSGALARKLRPKALAREASPGKLHPEALAQEHSNRELRTEALAREHSNREHSPGSTRPEALAREHHPGALAWAPSPESFAPTPRPAAHPSNAMRRIDAQAIV